LDDHILKEWGNSFLLKEDAVESGFNKKCLRTGQEGDKDHTDHGEA
jgi:hypothetical protein